MNEKKQMLLNDFLSKIPDKDKVLFQSIAEYAVVLGYQPKKTKTRIFQLDFTSNKLNKTILKLEAPDEKYENNLPGIRLKFYANESYSNIFHEGIKRVIEAFDGRYTGCYGCGKCKDGLEGYTYLYPDGKSVFRCGGELISITSWNESHLPEIRHLINTQNDFWVNQIIKGANKNG